MCKPSKHIIARNIIYFGAIFIALWLFPGAEYLSTTLCMALVWTIVSTAYRLTHNTNTCGWWTIQITATMLAVGIIANIHYFTQVSGGSITHPILQNPDAAIYYSDALASMGDPTGYPAPIQRHGYGMLISWLWHITGITILSPLVINMTFTLLSIILSGIIARHILSPHLNQSPQWISSAAMIMTASVCYYLNSGTLLLKEAGIGFGIALCIYAIIQNNDLKSYKKLAYFIVGIMSLMALRHSFIIFVAIAIVIITPWEKRSLINASIQLLICIAAWCTIGIIMNYFDLNQQVSDIVTGDHISQSYFYNHSQHATYNEMVGDYFSYTVGQRLLWLPISAITQFLTPFPWNFGRDTIFGYTLDYAHIAYPWYIIGAMLLFYIAWGWRYSTAALRRITIAGSILWLIPAYLFAGTVSRYTLPLLPMFIPAAVYIWATYRKNRALIYWGCIYTLLLSITLIVCYNLQNQGMQ